MEEKVTHLSFGKTNCKKTMSDMNITKTLSTNCAQRRKKVALHSHLSLLRPTDGKYCTVLAFHVNKIEKKRDIFNHVTQYKLVFEAVDYLSYKVKIT